MKNRSASAMSDLSLSGGSSELLDRLEAARDAIEGRFLAAGEILSQAVDGIGTLITALDRLNESQIDLGRFIESDGDRRIFVKRLKQFSMKSGYIPNFQGAREI